MFTITCVAHYQVVGFCNGAGGWCSDSWFFDPFFGSVGCADALARITAGYETRPTQDSVLQKRIADDGGEVDDNDGVLVYPLCEMAPVAQNDDTGHGNWWRIHHDEVAQKLCVAWFHDDEPSATFYFVFDMQKAV